MAEKLYKFFWDCGRQGAIDALFVAEENDIQAVIGKEIYFGEILGKHSEIYGVLDEGDFAVISENPIVIDALRDHPTGHSPLDYLDDEV